MNIASIYTNGLEKSKPCSNAHYTILPELKEKALEMLGKGMKQKYIAKTLGISEASVNALKCRERY